MNPPQACVAAVGQEPTFPSHSAARVPVPDVQDGGLHWTPASSVSDGQFGELPVQVSATSQTPFFARHVVPPLPAECVHPLVELQASTVHGLPSSQFGAAPPTHAPPEHRSERVQASPSEHGAVLFV